eukprot:3725813-Prymnesium_polylepis.1
MAAARTSDTIAFWVWQHFFDSALGAEEHLECVLYYNNFAQNAENLPRGPSVMLLAFARRCATVLCALALHHGGAPILRPRDQEDLRGRRP